MIGKHGIGDRHHTGIGDRNHWNAQIVHNDDGWRDEAVLYCTQTMCPEYAWYVPLAPSWLIGEKTRAVVRRAAKSTEERFASSVHSIVSREALAAAYGADTVKQLSLKSRDRPLARSRYRPANRTSIDGERPCLSPHRTSRPDPELGFRKRGTVRQGAPALRDGTKRSLPDEAHVVSHWRVHSIAVRLARGSAVDQNRPRLWIANRDRRYSGEANIVEQFTRTSPTSDQVLSADWGSSERSRA